MVGDFTNSRAPSLHGRYTRLTATAESHPSPFSPSIDFPVEPVIRSTLLRRFRAGTRRELLQLLGMSLSPCCRFHPAEVKEPHRSGFRLPHAAFALPVGGSAFGATHFSRPLCAFTCSSLRPGDSSSFPEGDVVDRLQSLGLPPLCYPSYGTSDFLPRQAFLLLNMPAFAGHTTGQAGFPASGSRTRLHAVFRGLSTPSAVSEHHAELMRLPNLHVLR